MELSAQVQHALVQRYARIRARLKEELGDPAVVLPTAEFFPDAFAADGKSVKRLVRRMQKHAGIDDIPIQVQVSGEAAESGGSCGTGSCGTGACATPTADDAPRVVDTGDGWTLNVPAAETAHPVVLTANLARALSSIFVMETQSDDEPLDDPMDVTVDIAGVQLGFGALLLAGSYIYSKSCGGPSVAKVTALGPSELGFCVALFLASSKKPFKPVLRELDTTQKAALTQAKEVTDSNGNLMTSLAEAPSRLADGEFKLESASPWLLRALGATKKKKERTLDEMSVEEMEAMLSMSAPKPKAKKQRSREDDELGALVAESLREAQSDAE